LVFQSAGVGALFILVRKTALFQDDETFFIKTGLPPGQCDVSLDAFQIGDKITLESGPFLHEATARNQNTHYVLGFGINGVYLKMNLK
jgi:hypothetical protein